MDIQAWAENFTHEIREKWEELRKIDPMFEAGFQVFYSPVRLRPELLILGFNPGGSILDFDIKDCERPPLKHQYLVHDYRLAKKMRSLFNGLGMEAILENSVKSNMIFFRSKSVDDWNKIDPKVRKNAESFCFSKALEMIEVLRPQKIMAEGLMTYEYLNRILGLDKQKEEALSKDRVLSLKNRTKEKIEVLGLIHPSGARISNAEWSLLRDEVKKFVA